MSWKKLNQQRREMERAVYEELKDDPTRRKEYIEGRIQKCRREQEVRAKREAEFTKGFWFIQDDLKRDNPDVRVFTGYIAGYEVAAAAVLRTRTDQDGVFYQVAYAICSPKDTFDWVKAKRYLGSRIQPDSTHAYRFALLLTKKGALSNERLEQLIRNHIETDAITARVLLPKHMLDNASLFGTKKFVSSLKYVDLKFTLPKRKRRRKKKKDEEAKPLSV